MPWAAGIALFFLTIAAMEGVAYAAHRWVMHGWGWFLHKSHHEPRTGAFELNDLYAVIFAVPSFVLLLGGVQLGWWPGFTWIGAGIAAYGAIYFGFHDVIVHRRLVGDVRVAETRLDAACAERVLIDQRTHCRAAAVQHAAA